MLIRTLHDAGLQPRNGFRYQPLQLIGPEELSTPAASAPSLLFFWGVGTRPFTDSPVARSN